MCVILYTATLFFTASVVIPKGHDFKQNAKKYTQ